MLMPKSEAELADIISNSAGPFQVQGGGTRAIFPNADAEILSVGDLSGVTLYEPGALTLVARAGTPIAEIEETLAGENQRLPFEPMDHRALLATEGVPTIGGVVAANISGPRRVQLGACRDYLIGVRFVDGLGNIVKNGGRVMKNVTGYDLVKLMAGSYGTLGVLSEVSFKVLAKPETELTLVKNGLAPNEAVATLSRALCSPYDVSGAAHVAMGEGRTQIRIEGLEGSVNYRKEKLLAALPGGFNAVSGEDSAALWAEVRDVIPFAGDEQAVWRVSVKPSDGPVLSERLSEQGIDHNAIYDWGGGLVWLQIPEASDCAASVVRPLTTQLGGHATLVKAMPQAKAIVPTFHPEPEPIAKISRAIRQKFDPSGKFNPGIMG